MKDGQRLNNAETGEALFLSQLELVERIVAFVCSRNHLSFTDADDFSSHVKLKFVESGYEILTKFQGRSSLRTYLTVVIQRLFLDYRISAWGKWRPSAAAKRGGPVAVLIEQLLVRDGYGFDEACELLATRHHVQLERRELERLIASLPVRFRRRFEPDEVLSSVASLEPGAEHALVEHERRQAAERVSTSMQRIIAGFDVQDRLILEMRFVDGRTVPEIATILRVDQKALYRRVDRLLKSLKAGLEAEGLERAMILEMLETASVTLEWSSYTEDVAARPSMRQGVR